MLFKYLFTQLLPMQPYEAGANMTVILQMKEELSKSFTSGLVN